MPAMLRTLGRCCKSIEEKLSVVYRKLRYIWIVAGSCNSPICSMYLYSYKETIYMQFGNNSNVV